MKKILLPALLLCIAVSTYCQNTLDSYNRGLKNYQARNYTAALTDLEKVVTVNPKDKDAWDIIGICYYRLELYRQAVTAFNKLYELDALYPQMYFFRGTAKGKLNDLNGALDDFTKQLALYSGDAVNHNNLGYIKLKLDRYADAIKDLDAAIKINPAYASPYANRGIAKYRSGLIAAARIDLDKAITLNPEIEDALLYRARINFKAGNIDAACIDVRKATALYPGKPAPDCKKWLMADDQFNIAMQEKEKQNYKKQVAHLDTAILVLPERAEFYAERARAKIDLKDYPGAVNDYSKAITADSVSFPGYYAERGFAKARIPDHSGAVKDYEKAIAMAPYESGVYYECGISLYYLNDMHAALNYLNKSLALNPDNADAYLFCGYCYGELKDYKNGLISLDKALQLDPKNVSGYYNRGLEKLMTNDFTGALRDLDKAITLNAGQEDDTRMYNCRGQAKFMLEDYKGALEDFNIVLKLDPKHIRALHNRAAVKFNLNDNAGGCADYKKSLQLGGEPDTEIEKYCK